MIAHLPAQVSRVVLLWIGAIIYFVVGVWMLYDAYNMQDDGGAYEVLLRLAPRPVCACVFACLRA